MPGLRVEAGRRLVEQRDVGVVDQRAGDGQPALHAAGQRFDPAVGPLAQLHEVEQLGGPRLGGAPRYPEVARVGDQVFRDGQLRVERVQLRADAEPGPDRGALPVRVHAEDPQRAGGGRGDAPDHPHRRALAGAVGAEEAERLAAGHVHVDAVDRGEVAEALDQAACVDHRFVRHAPTLTPGYDIRRRISPVPERRSGR